MSLPSKIDGLKAVCQNIQFKADNGFTIASFRSDDNTDEAQIPYDTLFSMKGVFSVSRGEPVIVGGKLDTSNEKYQSTYYADYVKYDIDFSNADKDEIIEYLSFLTSYTIAKRLYDEFGKDVLTILEEQDVAKLTSVKGVGEVVAENILEKFNNQKDYSEAFLALCKPYGITENAVRKIVDYFKDVRVAIDKVTANPYELTQLPGWGFKKADESFLKFHKYEPKAYSDMRRVKAYISYLFDEQYASGHTWLTPKMLVDKVLEFIPNANMKDVVNYVKFNEDFISIPVNDSIRITTVEFFNEELEIATLLSEKARTNWFKDSMENVEETIRKVEQRQGFNFDESQRKAIYTGIEQDIFLLQGLSGTGKSSTMSGLTEVFHHNRLSIGLCALSGKASNNLGQITGLDGMTIHRLLRLGAGFGKSDGEFNENNPLPYDVVIVDEISMVPNDIFLKLLKALKPKSKLIMVGDLGQLPSIGVGPANGIVATNIVPNFTLKNVHRQAQASAITNHSIYIRHGKQPKDLKLVKGETVYGDLQDMEYDLVSQDEEDSILKHSIEYYIKMLETYSVDDITLLSSTRANVFKLNQSAQIYANPKSSDKKEFTINADNGEPYVLRVGDRVANTRNNYNTFNYQMMNVPVFNGNTGVIRDMGIMEYNDGGDTGFCAIIDFDGVDRIVFPLNEKDNSLQLGYAMTVHKCLTGDTLINTNRGIMRLDELNNGAKIGEFKEFENDILVFNGESYEKPSHFYNNGVDIVNRIVTNNGYRLKATNEHLINIYRDGKLEQVTVDKLKSGDSLVLQLGAKNYNRHQVVYQDTESLSVSEMGIIVDNSFGRLLGCMVANGKIEDDLITFSSNSIDVVNGFIDLCVSVFSQYRIDNTNITEERTASGEIRFTYRITNRAVAKILKDIGNQQNRIPDVILKSPESVQVSFFSGLFDGNYTGNADLTESDYKTLQLMLLNMGVVSLNTGGTLMLKNSELVRLYHKGLRLSHPSKQASLVKMVESNTIKPYNRGVTIIKDEQYGELLIDEIFHIEKDSLEQTYCLTMPDTHKFIQNGFHAFNCQGSTLKTIIIAFPFQYMLNSREWLYTAITRASDYCVLITSPRTLQSAIKKSVQVSQRTNMKLMLENLESITKFKK